MSEAATPPIARPASNLLAGWTARYPEWVVVCVAIASWIALRDMRLSHDTFWQLWVARQLLGGTMLYTDIWEINPPLWFWAAAPVVWVAGKIGISAMTLLTPLLLAMCAGCALLTGQLISPEKPRARLWLMLLVFATIAIMPFDELGQRDQITLALTIPYAALIARRSAGLAVTAPTAIIIALFGAFGFALKHFFILVPLALELVLWLRLRRNWTPFRLELAVLGACAAAYALAVFWFAADFFTEALPMVRQTYDATDRPMLELFQHRWITFSALALVYIVGYRSEREPFDRPEAERFFQLLPVITGCFFFSYFIQHKGAFYHVVPAVGMLTIWLGLHVSRICRARPIPMAFGAALLAIPALALMKPTAEDSMFFQQSSDLLKGIPPGETVFVASDDPRAAWPAVETRGLKWVSRGSMLWMFPAIAREEGFERATPQMNAMTANVLRSTSEDLRCNPLARIIISVQVIIEGVKVVVERRAFLMRDQKLRQFIADHYVRIPGPNYAYVYDRVGNVAPINSPKCRVIH